jgi:hypothetical protein
MIKSRSARLNAMSKILQKGVEGPQLHLVLQNLIIEEGDRDIQLIQLLLRHGASINYIAPNGQNCIEIAAKKGDLETINLLQPVDGTNHTPIDGSILSRSFESCINIQGERRLATAERLLHLGVSVHSIDAQLLKVVKQNDLKLLKMMLQSRNGTPLQDTELFIVPIREGNIEAISLLLQAPPATSVMNNAFIKAIENNFLANNQNGLQIGDLLLSSNIIERETLNKAFLNIVQTYQPPMQHKFVELFLQHGADVNWENAAVIKVAAQNKEPNLFKRLLQAGARMNVVLRALINMAADLGWKEDHLIERLRLCIRPVDDIAEQRDGDLIILAMSRFPNSVKLVELLLKEGWSANYLSTCIIEDGQPEEIVPALLWAICQPGHMKINSAIIRELLKSGGK